MDRFCIPHAGFLALLSFVEESACTNVNVNAGDGALSALDPELSLCDCTLHRPALAV